MPTLDVHADDVLNRIAASEKVSLELHWMPFLLKLNASPVPTTTIENFGLEDFDRYLEAIIIDVLL
jgi:hypothetical protein